MCCNRFSRKHFKILTWSISTTHMGTRCHFACWDTNATFPSSVSFPWLKENNSRGCQMRAVLFMATALSSGVDLCLWSGGAFNIRFAVNCIIRGTDIDCQMKQRLHSSFTKFCTLWSNRWISWRHEFRSVVVIHHLLSELLLEHNTYWNLWTHKPLIAQLLS